MSKGKENPELVRNRKARFNYEIEETFEAGLLLKGTEIKSLREGGGSLQEAYIKIIRGELFLVNASIAPYKFGNVHNHEEARERKLLMHKREIERLRSLTQEKGYAIIPLSIYLKKGRAKLQIATGRGKKSIDKREAIKSRDEKRRVDRAMKSG